MVKAKTRRKKRMMKDVVGFQKGSKRISLDYAEKDTVTAILEKNVVIAFCKYVSFKNKNGKLSKKFI